MIRLTVFRTMFFGWQVVAAAFIIATFTFGIGYYGPSVFLNVLHQQRGWPVSVISIAVNRWVLASRLFAHPSN